MNNYFGEIVVSSLTSWTIQCWDLEGYPNFGSLIQADYNGNQNFGIVCDIQTGPKDANRTPFSFGKTIEQLKQEQPHIFQLLHSMVTCIPIGYFQEDAVIREIPKRPAPIHTFTKICPPHTMKKFFDNASWVNTFFSLAGKNPLFDELLVATIRQAYENKSLDKGGLHNIVDVFSLLTHDDYRKLKIFLQRIEVFIH